MSGTRTMGMRLSALAVAAAAALAATMALGAGQAKAGHLTCGQNVTGTVKLDSNLTNCGGPGLIVNGPNVTIDLNGFTIDGGPNNTSIGIDNTSAQSGLTVVNGTIQEFFDGVWTEGPGGRFNRLTVKNNAGDGFHLEAGGADNNSLVSNTATGNRDFGIFIVDGSDNNVVDLNSATGNGNTSSFFGGIAIANSDRNRVTRNTLSANIGSGISLVQGADNNQIVGNQSNANRGTSTSDGIFILSGSDNNLLDTNTTNNNRDDGIDVEDADTQISRNTARNNGDWGIEAVPGVRHSGNRASGNGRPGQCLNVSCSA